MFSIPYHAFGFHKILRIGPLRSRRAFKSPANGHPDEKPVFPEIAAVFGLHLICCNLFLGKDQPNAHLHTSLIFAWLWLECSLLG